MKMRTKQATTVLTRQLQKMRWTARTAAKMLPEKNKKMRICVNKDIKKYGYVIKCT